MFDAVEGDFLRCGGVVTDVGNGELLAFGRNGEGVRSWARARVGAWRDEVREKDGWDTADNSDLASTAVLTSNTHSSIFVSAKMTTVARISVCWSVCGADDRHRYPVLLFWDNSIRG